ncbi:MAG: nuclear transport factor 2 family protein, partial [Bacteroidota bacterium]
VDLFNRGAAEALGELYHDQSVNHQVPLNPVHGKAAIVEQFRREFAGAEMTCIVERIYEDGEWGILEWIDPVGLRGCGFFQVVEGKIKFQRGYWDQLTFLKLHRLPLPKDGR